jgi:hypothetical protein
MTRRIGQISFLLAIGSWIGYFSLLLLGGIDPAPVLSRILQTAMLFTLAGVFLALGLALFALATGHQRIWATVALILCLLFGLVFSGIFFAILPAY